MDEQIITYKVKYRVSYSNFENPNDHVPIAKGTLYVNANNVGKAYEYAVKKLTGFCGDDIYIISIVQDYKPGEE